MESHHDTSSHKIIISEDPEPFKNANENKKEREIQPKTHEFNKSFIETLCFCVSKKNDLSQTELKIYYALKEKCAIFYQDDNEEHIQTLKTFYKNYFGRTLEQNDLNNTDWMILGFQDKNPQTDFRGAGLMGLENMVNFLEKDKRILDEMCESKNNFMFAMISLNFTFFLKTYLHLASFLDYQKDREIICSRKILKRAFKILNNEILMGGNESDGFNKFHEVLMKFAFFRWRILIQNNKELNMCEFHYNLEDVKNTFKEIMENAEINSFHDLGSAFEKIIMEIKS